MAIGFKVHRYKPLMEALGKLVTEYKLSSRSKRKGLNPWLDPSVFFKSFIPLFFLGAVALTIPSVLGSVDENLGRYLKTFSFDKPKHIWKPKTSSTPSSSDAT